MEKLKEAMVILKTISIFPNLFLFISYMLIRVFQFVQCITSQNLQSMYFCCFHYVDVLFFIAMEMLLILDCASIIW